VGSDRKAGFGTFVEEMMNRLVNAGARWFPNYELKAIAQSSAPADKQLTFGNGAQAVASKLILNMPQRALLKVLRASSLPMGALDGGYFEALSTVATEALHTVATEIVTNVYLCAKERVVANHTVGWFAAPTARWVCRPAVHKLLAVRRP
jgi:protoporphyrinogen oxidase